MGTGEVLRRLRVLLISLAAESGVGGVSGMEVNGRDGDADGDAMSEARLGGCMLVLLFSFSLFLICPFSASSSSRH